MSVTSIYANLARSKALWAQYPLDHPLSERFAQEGLAAAEMLAATPAANPSEMLMKLAELQEIAAGDLIKPQSALLASTIEDMQSLLGGPVSAPAPGKPAATLRPSAPAKSRVHRTARPVTIDGKLYPSITAAAKATGIAYEALRTGRIG
jgi:hypothetical protein